MPSAIRFARRSLYAGAAALALVMTAGGARAEDAKVTPVAGTPALLLSGFDLAPFGFSTEEFFVSGTAASYKFEGTPGEDGKWSVSPAESAPYLTRIVVVRPTDPKKFNGTVLVEWLNVTAGTDASPDWNMTHREILRSGYAYVAASVQKVGIDGAAQPGGMAVGAALKKQNPERYASLVHPGDVYSYDMYSQIGRLVRGGKILGNLKPKHVVSMGESQSAAFLTTYINAVDPVAKVYEGFLVHSRFGGGSALQGAGGMGGGAGQPRSVKFRPDLRVPLIAVETETDVLGTGNAMGGYSGARQPDNDKLRQWEVPGTAHADNYSFAAGSIDSGQIPIEKLAAAWAPMQDIMGSKLAFPINNAPQHHYVVQAAMVRLNEWVSAGKKPSSAPPMKTQMEGEKLSYVRDANGLTEGGVRTPWVDAPTARLGGSGNSGNPVAFLAGMADPFDAAKLDQLYPGGKADYMKKVEASLDAAIKGGFILVADRKEILDLTAVSYKGSH